MISVVILTKNSAASLAVALESVQHFKEVVVYDTGSTDTTLEIATSYPNVILVQGTLEGGFGAARNRAATFATHDWIFALDSDEVVSPSLCQSLLSLSLNPQMVYGLRRINYFLGKRMRSCSGWGKDFVNRLYHRQHHSFSEDHVHEKIPFHPSHHQWIEGDLLHTPYRGASDLLSKMQHYSDLYALQAKPLKIRFSKVIFHALVAFLKSYLLKGGIFQGARGLILSTYLAQSCFYKYLKVWEKGLNLTDSILEKRQLK